MNILLFEIIKISNVVRDRDTGDTRLNIDFSINMETEGTIFGCRGT